MAQKSSLDNRFGKIAIDMQLLSREQLERALVVQELIYSRTHVHMAIGKVLKEMGALNQDQIDDVLKIQRTDSNDNAPPPSTTKGVESESPIKGMTLNIAKDKLTALVAPKNSHFEGPVTVEILKEFIEWRGVVFGLVDDETLSSYVARDPLPEEPFIVAKGEAPVPGIPPEIIYHFETDPLKIGTLKKDGTMDWKDRGDIPYAKVDDMLAEKTEGVPGKPGTSVLGKELPPPRLKVPKLKNGRGAKRSKDGKQILAKIDGTPKLSSDGKVYVFGVLNINSDIGVETGHIEFDGYVESTGGVCSGYTVKSKGLRTSEIQDATIEVKEDLVCHAGMYGSTIKVGGNLKASHIHNCTIEVQGELVVEKELYESTIETNGRCLIVDGKIIDSKIDAKKGVYAKDIGSQGSNPCELALGFDRKYERESAACKEEKKVMEQQMAKTEEALPKLKEELDAITTKISTIAVEQDQYMLQKQQFEEQLRGEGPNPVDTDDDEERMMLEGLIDELVEKMKEFDTTIAALMGKEDNIRKQLAEMKKRIELLKTHIEKSDETKELLEAAYKDDPGIPVTKVSGTIFSKTHVTFPHKEITTDKDLSQVRIAESRPESTSSKFEIKISPMK